MADSQSDLESVDNSQKTLNKIINLLKTLPPGERERVHRMIGIFFGFAEAQAAQTADNPPADASRAD